MFYSVADAKNGRCVERNFITPTNVKDHNGTNWQLAGSFMRLITEYMWDERFVLPHRTYTEISGTVICIGFNSL